MWGLDATTKQELMDRIRASATLSKLMRGGDDEVRAFHAFAYHLSECRRLELRRTRLGANKIPKADIRAGLAAIETALSFLRRLDYPYGVILEFATEQIRELRKIGAPSSRLSGIFLLRLDATIARVLPCPMKNRRDLISKVIWEVFRERKPPSAIAKAILEGARAGKRVRQKS
jgi:hypothetical protein